MMWGLYFYTRKNSRSNLPKDERSCRGSRIGSLTVRNVTDKEQEHTHCFICARDYTIQVLDICDTLRSLK